MKTYYLGIDPSLNGTAIIVLDGEGETVSENLLTPPRVSKKPLQGIPRLMWLRDEFVKLIEGSREGCVRLEVVVEDYAYGAKNQAHQLGEWGGILRLALYERGIDFHTVPTTSLKQFVCGKGNAQKDDMKMHIYKQWGKEFSNDNLCDAYGLAQLLSYKMLDKGTRTQAKATQKATLVKGFKPVRTRVIPR